MAVEPRFLPSYLQLCGEGGSQLTCVDAAELAGEQEEVAYVELQRRALVERQVAARAGGHRWLGADHDWLPTSTGRWLWKGADQGSAE